MKPAQKLVAKPQPEAEQLPPAPVRWWPWLASLVASVCVFAAGTVVALGHSLVGKELALFHFINNWPDRLRTLFVVATIAPESLWIAVAAVVVTFLLKMYRLAWQLAAGTLAGYVLGYAAKHFISRGRPIELTHDVAARVHESGPGFPSGHAMIVTIIVLIMWPHLPRGWRWLVALLIPLVALSRVYLGVHAPLDVVGGVALGVAVVAAMRLLPRKLRLFLRFDKP